jgi:uncharacterized protein with ParB-like and HNH nuclease domain
MTLRQSTFAQQGALQMSEQYVQSQDINVTNVFQSFYVVPDYQREYVWEGEQVEQLLSDIQAEWNNGQGNTSPEYFIGSIVVCPHKGDALELIDGQQRMTTLFLTLCAIRDRCKQLGQTPPSAIGGQIAASYTDVAGEDRFCYRLELQYEDSRGVLKDIAEGSIEQEKGSTRSVANILGAYRATCAFLSREFESDIARLKGYYGYLTNKVKLIRIQTEDVAKALKIFETINDRGVGLDAMDLLKNLLFMKANSKEFEQLKTIWKEMQDGIYHVKEKPLRFLRYFILSQYDVDVLREDQIYTWFSKNDAKCNYSKQPVAFAKELLAAAKAYQNFLTGKDCVGNKNPYLENLQLLGGSAARQHLILLLAGRHLQSEQFDRLAGAVENLFFVYVITRQPTRDFERNFAAWAPELRKVKTGDELSVFIDKRFDKARKSLSDRFDDAFTRLDEDGLQQYRLRYVLAKLTQFVDLQGFGDKDGTRWLGRYAKDFEIEHIYPQTPSNKAQQEFGPSSADNIAARLGNLVLAEKAINASLGNRPYSTKQPVYKQSQLLLTRALSEQPKVGTNTRIDAAVKDLKPFQKWDENAVGARQDALRKLARKVWNV